MSFKKILSFTQKVLEAPDSFPQFFNLFALDINTLGPKMHGNLITEEGGVVLIHSTSLFSKSRQSRWEFSLGNKKLDKAKSGE